VNLHCQLDPLKALALPQHSCSVETLKGSSAYVDEVQERGWVLMQGSGGAFEISQRMTAMLGWGATVFQEDWTWTQSSEMYVLDEGMASTLRKSNPEAFRNVVARMLEAAGRGMWAAPAGTLEKLQEVYSDLDEQLEKF
jgi:cobalamin biosynthesis Mg chelatase CobN